MASITEGCIICKKENHDCECGDLKFLDLFHNDPEFRQQVRANQKAIVEDPDRCNDCGRIHHHCICADQDDIFLSDIEDDDWNNWGGHDCIICGRGHGCGVCECVDDKCVDCRAHPSSFAHCENCLDVMCGWCWAHSERKKSAGVLRDLALGTDSTEQKEEEPSIEAMKEVLRTTIEERGLPLYEEIRELHCLEGVKGMVELFQDYFASDSANLRCTQRDENGGVCLGCLWALSKKKIGNEWVSSFDYEPRREIPFGHFTPKGLFDMLIEDYLLNFGDGNIAFIPHHMDNRIYSCMPHEQEAYENMLESMDGDRLGSLTWVELMKSISNLLQQ